MDCEGAVLLGSEYTCDYFANKLPEVVPSSSLDSVASLMLWILLNVQLL
jgi:hypothetical protein